MESDVCPEERKLNLTFHGQRQHTYQIGVLLVYSATPSQCGATAERLTLGGGPGFDPRLDHLGFPLGKEINRHC